jgi:V8-like Glu-specific endopeptidase
VRIAASTVLLSALICFGVPSVAAADPGKATEALISGSPSRGDEPVVGLIANERVYCTGVLIAPDVIITAAHCIYASAPTHVLFAAAEGSAGEVVPVQLARRHSGYVPGDKAGASMYDVGGLQLARRVETVTPAQLASSAEPLEVGDTLRLVGFGSLAPSGNYKATGEALVANVEVDRFFHEASPSRICGGDSGGPALVVRADKELVVGIASGGEAECSGRAVHTRMSETVHEFVGNFPTPRIALGERCRYDSSCGSGHCVDAVNASGTSYCSQGCADDTDCPNEMTCEVDLVGGRWCRYRNEPGILGSTCSDKTDCGSTLCLDFEATPHAVCSLRCFEENLVACPDGFECAPALNSMLFGCVAIDRSASPHCSASRVAAEKARCRWPAVALLLSASAWAVRRCHGSRRDRDLRRAS